MDIAVLRSCALTLASIESNISERIATYRVKENWVNFVFIFLMGSSFVVNVLNNGAYLVLGGTEFIDDGNKNKFREIVPHTRVFKKR